MRLNTSERRERYEKVPFVDGECGILRALGLITNCIWYILQRAVMKYAAKVLFGRRLKAYSAAFWIKISMQPARILPNLGELGKKAPRRASSTAEVSVRIPHESARTSERHARRPRVLPRASTNERSVSVSRTDTEAVERAWHAMAWAAQKDGI